MEVGDLFGGNVQLVGLFTLTSQSREKEVPFKSPHTLTRLIK